MFHWLAWLVAAAWYTQANATPLGETFNERLTLRPLTDGKVLAAFDFEIAIEGSRPRDPRTLGQEDQAQHHTLYPLPLAQILREYAVDELHLSLNSGKWNYDRWGYPEESGVGTGAELWAYFGEGGSLAIEERWSGLRNSLAGLFCASLGSLDKQRTSSPTSVFPPVGKLPVNNLGHQLKHAVLPSENVCTENLTPFLKLLPCKSFSGIASLFNPHRLLDADWHGLGVHAFSTAEGQVVKFVLQAVLDPVRLHGKRGFSLWSLFERRINGTCPASSSSIVLVDPSSGSEHIVSPTPTKTLQGVQIYDTRQVQYPFDVEISWPKDHLWQRPTGNKIQSQSALSILRTLGGASQDRGQLSISLKNHEDFAVEATYLETLPWLLQFYLHTTKSECSPLPCSSPISNRTYIPPKAHLRPGSLQFELLIPPQSTLRISMEVHKTFLRYTEHPPDASRGWDLPPAVVLLKNGPASPKRLYTSTLLIDLATPDFSMPYNVIIMTCTLITLIFGSVFNLLMRKFILVDLTETAPKKAI